MGRPKKVKTPEEMQKLIDRYFSETPEQEWTITGLALACGFSMRQTLWDYAERPEYREFHDVVKKAKLKVQQSYEKDLRKRQVAGPIFALKQFGWRDRQEVEVTEKDPRLTDDDIDTIRQVTQGMISQWREKEAKMGKNEGK